MIAEVHNIVTYGYVAGWLLAGGFQLSLKTVPEIRNRPQKSKMQAVEKSMMCLV